MPKLKLLRDYNGKFKSKIFPLIYKHDPEYTVYGKEFDICLVKTKKDENGVDVTREIPKGKVMILDYMVMPFGKIPLHLFCWFTGMPHNEGRQFTQKRLNIKDTDNAMVLILTRNTEIDASNPLL